MEPLKIGIIGTGNRGRTLALHLTSSRKGYGDKSFQNKLVLEALCDTNEIRLRNVAQEINGKFKPKLFTDYQKLLEKSSCQLVIVATPDFLHHEICLCALKAGKDILCEKPLATTVKDCQEIIKAVKRTKRNFRVIFNMRYQPVHLKVKELLTSGTIGNLISCQVNEIMSAFHGADYFRRWHRKQRQSGGLLITKACHIFDLMNWFIDSQPQKVVCFGERSFFKKKFSRRRCLTCSDKKKCLFFFDLKTQKDGLYNRLFLQAEGKDGYFRDQCVFSKEAEINDFHNVLVSYRNKVQLNFFFTSFAPAEKNTLHGQDRLLFFLGGEKGTIEVFQNEASKEHTIEISQFLKRKKIIKIPPFKGSHGGGDVLLLKSLVHKDRSKVQQEADVKAGLLSVLIGEMANISLREKRIVEVKEILGKN
jgi:predicted dehydrogenase